MLKISACVSAFLSKKSKLSVCVKDLCACQCAVTASLVAYNLLNNKSCHSQWSNKFLYYVNFITGNCNVHHVNHRPQQCTHSPFNIHWPTLGANPKVSPVGYMCDICALAIKKLSKLWRHQIYPIRRYFATKYQVNISNVSKNTQGIHRNFNIINFTGTVRILCD